MKTIKISFINFWGGFIPEQSLFYKILESYFNIELTDTKQADYVFYSVWGDDHWFVPDTCVKIFFTGENRTPDFNACDYAIGFERITFRDRYLRFPLYYTYQECSLMQNKHKNIIRDEIKNRKKGFCSFTVSNPDCPPRINMFNTLSKYKHIDSGGRFMNNIGEPVKDKFAFDSQHKFTIAYENFSYNGYITEKIVQAFAAQTIPIYWGDPQVGDVFNKKAFINVNDYNSIENVVEIIKEIDNNDELYFAMLETPALVSQNYTLESQKKCLESFLLNIFNQPKDAAQRRTRYAKHTAHIQQKVLNTYYASQMSWLQRIYHSLKK